MKTAVVTGAGGAMGSKLVVALEKEGIDCILIERKNDLFGNLLHVLDGHRHSFYEADLTDERAILEVVNQIAGKHSKIDYLFNVAGIGIYKKIEDLTFSEWRNSLAVNLTAPFILTKTLLPLLKKSKNSMVLSFGSGMGVIPRENRVAYCTSKFALRGFSLTMTKEFKGRGVDFVLLTLGSVMTDFGTGGLIYRKKLQEKGKKYLEVNDVVERIIEIVNSDKRKEEYVIYPEGYEEED